MKKIIENAPEVAESFFNMTNKITQYGSEIEIKNKELILVGMFVAAGGYNGVKTHAGRALEAGSSQKEIISAILYAIPVVGISKVNIALEEVIKLFSNIGGADADN